MKVRKVEREKQPTTKPLGNEIAEIEQLRADLSAEIVIDKGEEGHEEYLYKHGEEVYEGGYYGGGSPWGSGPYDDESNNPRIWVDGKPDITQQDTQKREAARERLHRIRENSDWITARYKARSALDDRIPVKIDHEFDLWFGELKMRLKGRIASLGEAYSVQEDLLALYEDDVRVNRELRRRAGKLLGIKEADIFGHEIALGYDLERWQIEYVSHSAIQMQYRELASRVLGKGSADFLANKLHQSEESVRPKLQEVYRQATNQGEGAITNRYLSYSGAIVWIHEHPIATTLMGVAIVVSSGLVYGLVEYLSK